MSDFYTSYCAIEVMMRELPIIFSAAMVRAIRDGRKTQARRVPMCPGLEQPMIGEDILDRARKRYGEPGDVLYVREAWRTAAGHDMYSPQQIGDMALDLGHEKPWAPICYEADQATRDECGNEWGRLRPSIHMPRWASRIRLTRKSPLRIERLSEITCDDILAEGIECPQHTGDYKIVAGDGKGGTVRVTCRFDCPDLRPSWETSWDGINGKRPGAGTADDPLVVVVDWGDVEVLR